MARALVQTQQAAQKYLAQGDAMPSFAVTLARLLGGRRTAVFCRKLLIVVSQVALIALAYYVSFQLRFEFELPGDIRRLIAKSFLIVILVKVVAFYYFGLLRGWWRYVGISDLVDITKAASSSSLLIYFLFFLVIDLNEFPRSVMGIDWLLTILVVGGARFLVRAYTEALEQHAGDKNILVVGTGREAASLVRDLRHSAESGCNPIAIIDEDRSKLGIKIHGVPVVGTFEAMGDVITRYGIKCVLIALPSPTNKQVQRIIENCRSSKVEFKILPTLGNRINGGNVLGLIRDIKVEDLLGRAPVALDVEAIRTKLQDKVVLITGAAGSIGSELARQVASFRPTRLVLLDRAENDQFRLSMELSRKFPDLDYVSAVGDILDSGLLRDLFALHRPHSVFHAAAYKHVPLMERNCFQAVNNNILGTYNVALISRQFAVEDFVLISSDKAVNPTNVMGVTKRACELIILALRRQRTRFMAVRFGNVLGSAGSVLPIFQRQIADGGPLTITHPDVMRYFMTIPEAVQLVLQASTMGKGGEIFVLEMGEPVRIRDLATNLIHLSGLQPETDINLVYTGLRPGEKMFEELCLESEDTKATSHDKIRVFDGGFADFEKVKKWVDELSALVIAKNMGGIISKLQDIVPEYRPSDEVLSECDVDRHDVVLRRGMERTHLITALIDQEPPQRARAV
jgi:FlaA1/EpsC-like NDP-sugar epimerase